MKKIIILGFLIMLLSGCSIYYPSQVLVSNENSQRFDVDISRDNTEVNITVKELPRRLIIYELEDTMIQFRCYDVHNSNKMEVINHSIFWTYGVEEKTIGNSVYSYPRIEVDNLIDELYFEDNRFECHIRPPFKLNRIEYVDGIKLSNETYLIFWDDIVKSNTDIFKIDCRDYNLIGECEIYADPQSMRFIESPYQGIYMLHSYITNNLR